MALFNVSTANNTLLATAHTAHAESNIINQDATDTDFESIRQARVKWLLADVIDAGQSGTDFAVVNAPVVDGDRIFVRKSDGTIADTTAIVDETSITPAHPFMDSNTTPSGVCNASDNSSAAWYAFDNDESTTNTVGVYYNGWVSYQFENNTPTLINQFKLKTDYYDGSYRLEGSLDGTNWATIGEYGPLDAKNGVILDVQSPGEFSHYRIINLRYNTWVYFSTFWLLSNDGRKIDTTNATQGEIPQNVFRFTDTVSFNSTIATEQDIYYEYGTSGSKLYALSLYNNVQLAGRQVTTRVDFGTNGNEVTEITGQLYKVV